MEKSIEGQKFGRYRVVEILGAGTMSTVYKAVDPFLNREVAVKVIHQRVSVMPEFATRFEREVTTLANLNHPGIIEILDMGIEEGKTYYMVLKLVRGGTLKERLESFTERNQMLSLQDIEHILVGVSNALDYMHGRGIVHRDLKPANVMFTEQGMPLLADFGLVKITGGESYTITHGLLGTPLYMSPEQCKQDRIDHRCDIYSLGAILYEMTTGRKMFQAGNLMEILVAHIEKLPTSPNSINPNLPEAVAEVIMKAVRKEPDARYQTAQELANAFSDALVNSGEKASFPQNKRYAYFCSVVSGKKYRLHGSIDNRIGRSKPNNPVEIDLTGEKGNEYIHSLHAIVRYSSTGWELEPAQGIQNPVFINGTEISPGLKIILSEGDRIKFSDLELVIEMNK